MEFIQQHMEFIQQNYMLMLSAAVSGQPVALSLRRPDNKHSVNATQATMLINSKMRSSLMFANRRSMSKVTCLNRVQYSLGQLEQRLGDLERTRPRRSS